MKNNPSFVYFNNVAKVLITQALKQVQQRWNIINFFIEHYNFNSYLEIGSRWKTNFNKINIKNKFCVDPAEFNNKEHVPDYNLTSDEFFEQNTSTFDIIFIDGLHLQEQVKLDISNSLKVLNEGGIIVCHDMNPLTKKSQTREYKPKTAWHGDVWKEWVNLRTLTNLSMYVIDCDTGLGIIKKGKQTPITLPDKIDYKWLSANRKTALNLISFEDFVNHYEKYL